MSDVFLFVAAAVWVLALLLAATADLPSPDPARPHWTHRPRRRRRGPRQTFQYGCADLPVGRDWARLDEVTATDGTYLGVVRDVIVIGDSPVVIVVETPQHQVFYQPLRLPGSDYGMR